MSTTTSGWKEFRKRFSSGKMHKNAPWRDYMTTNLSSLLPAAVASLVVVVAVQISTVSHGACEPLGSVCSDTKVINEIFGAVRPGPDHKPKYTWPASFATARAAHQGELDATEKKARDDAAAEKDDTAALKQLQDAAALKQRRTRPL